MHKIIPIIFLLLLICCLNAPHDNKYDPKNPDKAGIKGYAWDFDSTLLKGVNVNLFHGHRIIKTDTSDVGGRFEINDIDPGVYAVEAKAQHYKPIELYPETLSAHTDKYLNLTFNSLYFEDDQSGIAEPYDFQVINGNWRIEDDFSDPSFHTTPHVYRGNYSDTAGFAMTVYKMNLKNFVAKTKLVIANSSSPGWEAGIVFHYQDINNYYFLQVTADSARFFKVINDSQALISAKQTNFPINVWSMITIECFGRFAFCYFDNNYQFGMKDSSFMNGLVGFWLSNLQTGGVSQINFDDLTFYPNISDTLLPK